MSASIIADGAASQNWQKTRVEFEVTLEISKTFEISKIF